MKSSTSVRYAWWARYNFARAKPCRLLYAEHPTGTSSHLPPSHTLKVVRYKGGILMKMKLGDMLYKKSYVVYRRIR